MQNYNIVYIVNDNKPARKMFTFKSVLLILVKWVTCIFVHISNGFQKYGRSPLGLIISCQYCPPLHNYD